VLRIIFGRNKEAVQEDEENYIMRSSIICTVPQIRTIKSRRMRWK